MRRTIPKSCASAARVYDALGWMERALSITPCLAGDDITAADIVALRPEAIEIGLGLEDLGVRLPVLGAWVSRMKTMRGYDAAFPPHWRS